MKKLLFYISLISSLGLYGQVTISLSGTQTTGGTQTACQSITLKPSFSFKAEAGKSMSLQVNPSTCDPYSGKEASLSGNQNYIRTRTYTNAEGTRYLDQIQYFDGLGRPVQTVQRGITPLAQDLVSLQEYDAFGRESNVWLPGRSSGNGAYVDPATVKTAAISLNGNDQSPYSKPVYEASPLNRVLKQLGPGADWQNKGKSVKTEFMTNIAKTAPDLGVADSLVCGMILCITNLTYSYTRNYGVGELYVTRVKDEDDNTSYEFKDKLGQVVLTRQINNKTEMLDTYYVYDDFGNLSAVFPPLAMDLIYKNKAELNTGSSVRSKYAYLYSYDTRNRCIKKKIPGVDWTYYVYDKADRVIFTQDGEQRTTGEWTFSIPDVFGRVVLTGSCKSVNNNPNIYAGRFDNYIIKAEFAPTGTHMGYNVKVGQTTFNTLSIENPIIYSVNYYDNYKFRSLSGFSESTMNYRGDISPYYYNKRYGDDTPASEYKHKGLLTGTMIAVFQNGDNTVPEFLYSTMYYDDKHRLIQSRSSHHLKGVNTEYIAYNFTGQPVRRLTGQTKPNQKVITEYYTYTYDHAGRLLKTTHQLGEDGSTPKPMVVLAENSYDELGRLKTSKKNNQVTLNTTYTYNVRSWTKRIAHNHLVENLDYSYSGNISRMDWTVANKTREYKFSYDQLSRLTKADYAGITSGIEGEKYGTSYSYDKHGNIKTLQQYGKTTTGSTYDLVDNLTLTYNGNQLVNVKDGGVNVIMETSDDFKDYAKNNGVYAYNKNGAMNKDTHKGISEIKYNSLNLPMAIEIANTDTKGRIKYVYSAAGVKLQTTHIIDPDLYNAPMMGITSYTSATAQTDVTDYVGNKVYENGSLKRILVDGGYYDPTDNKYYFFLTDHLGNNRVVADQNGTVVQKNHYYPFGMSFAEGTTAEQNKQPYKYNGKEFDRSHKLNMYDYSARQYEPAVGRFTSVDPHAENYYSWSPYCYVGNNPLRRTDPNGKDWWDKLKGALVAIADNASFGVVDLRTQMGKSVNDASDYNMGQNVGDVLSIVAGAMEVEGGAANLAAGTAVTVGSGGTASMVSVPVAVAGGAQIVHGAATAINGANNLASQKGRISEVSSSGNSGGKGSNHLKPSTEATGDHSSFRRGTDGKITNTATYKQNSKNPTGFDEVKRVDKVGGSHKNKAGQEIPTPHVHDKAIKDVRPARLDELPK